jgi:hypothetical protein
MKMYLRIFNFLVRRVVAIAFSIGGTVVALAGLPAILPGGTIDVNGVPSTDLIFRWAAVVLPFVVAALGVALYRAKPFNE